MKPESKHPRPRLQSAGSGSGINRRTRVALGDDSKGDDWSVGLNDLEKALVERHHRSTGLPHVLILSKLGIGALGYVRKHLELLFDADFVDLKNLSLQRVAPLVLSTETMAELRIVPFRTDWGSILIASANPTDALIEKVEKLMQAPFRIVVCTEHSWNQVAHRLGLFQCCLNSIMLGKPCVLHGRDVEPTPLE